MNELLEWMEYIEDSRQQAKVRHKLKDILVIVLFATLANANDWVEMELFAQTHQHYLKKYISLENGIPSHDTLSRVMGMLSTQTIQQLCQKWQDLLNRNEGETIKKIICTDGKTMRGSKTKHTKPNHIISAWCKEDGFCLGQKAADEKSNEITAIPELLDHIQIKGHIITIDAMGTQKEIAQKLRNVLALKGNQGSLHEDVQLYMQDEETKKAVKAQGGYKRTIEKAHGQIEKREYCQTEDIRWINQREEWKGLKSIGMEEKTIKREDGTESKEYRYYISSLKKDIETFRRAVRGHWSIESMHWHLDVTFREDANSTLDKQAAQNLNIIRKWSLSILKLIEIMKPKLSLKKKRFVIGLKPLEYIEQILMMV